jgi:hypothetical protein
MPSQLRRLVGEAHRIGMDSSEPFLFYQSLGMEEASRMGVVPKEFKGIRYITVYVSSLGKVIDTVIQEKFALKETAFPVLLDAWGSEALEQLNERFDRDIRQGKKGTRRFSPGYGDVDIRKNFPLYEYLVRNKGEEVGRRITVNPDTGILIPRKSTIGMIGWFS